MVSVTLRHHPERQRQALVDFRIDEALLPGDRSGLVAVLRDFGVAVAAAELGPYWDDKVHLLSVAERAGIERAVPKRQREIIAGRLLARELLRRIGRGDDEVPRREDRCPAWPQGLVGSITHTDTLCAVALAPASLAFAVGIDLEPHIPLDRDIWPVICGPQELDRALGSEHPGLWVRWAFSAKEAYYKAQFPTTGRFIEARELEVELDLPRQAFSLAFVDPQAADPHDERFLAGTGRLCVSDETLGAAWVVGQDPGIQ